MTYERGLAICGAAVLLWSAISPADRFTWYLEVFPGVVLAGTFWCLARRGYPFTRLVNTLVFVHCVILFVGGHYTYADVPLFDWLQARFDLSRNYYDRIGHLAQGFIPAMIAREVLLRSTPLARGKMLALIVASICLAFSALYEIFEAAVSITVSLTVGGNADAFLGAQGDPWDTQWDMFCALVGASAALLLLSRVHDNQLDRASGVQSGSLRM